jgi:hypothetical protein
LLHIFLLPLLAIIFISVHYYKVSREHSISLPAAIEEGEAPPAKIAAAKRKIDILPDLLTSELMWIAITLAGMIVAVSFFYSAALETHANALKTPLHTTAPWYFLWLQGMLKLGDKTWWGVIIPTIIFGLLFAVPYLDPGPSRLAKNRKVGITVGIVTTVLLVVLSFMGTGLWGVSAPPAAEIIQEFIPEEGVGEIREIPYDELFVGEYDTNDPSTFPGGHLGEVLAEMREATHRESDRLDNNFFNGSLIMEIEQWLPNLKRMTITVSWEEVPEGSTTDELVENSFQKSFFFHEDSDYTLLE